ncbi:unnamed protein product [Paramecium primaurelia]|uniref:Uncharacterized protein n=1 Tax=Paramecium primaurelia TaxID=5886 RepID=A0A8S1K8T3_PARPR|nr:unnamed protein product [Paramecium primaurelia]
MLDYAFKTHQDTIYNSQEVQSIIDQIVEIQNSNLLINPTITVTPQKIFKVLFLNHI